MKFALYLPLVFICLIGCSPKLTPITEDLIEEYQFDQDALQHIQYYISSDIVLYRSLSNGESVIENGKVVLRNGKNVEEIVIKAGTPGVYLFSPKPNHLAISFEEDNDHYLVFGPIKNRSGRFRLMANQWNKNFGVVTYGRTKYRTPSSSAYAELVIDLQAYNKVTRRRTTASGRTINP